MIHYPTEGARELAPLEDDHFWFRTRRAAVHGLLRRHLHQGTCVGIDIGCGNGTTAGWLTSQGYPTVGLDAYLPVRPLSAGFVQSDVLCLEPQPRFDFVLLLFDRRLAK